MHSTLKTCYVCTSCFIIASYYLTVNCFDVLNGITNDKIYDIIDEIVYPYCCFCGEQSNVGYLCLIIHAAEQTLLSYRLFVIFIATNHEGFFLHIVQNVFDRRRRYNYVNCRMTNIVFMFNSIILLRK